MLIALRDLVRPQPLTLAIERMRHRLDTARLDK
jgi:hypothetical protein